MQSVVFGLQAHGDSLGNPTAQLGILKHASGPVFSAGKPVPLIANDLAKDLIEADGDATSLGSGSGI